MSSVKSVTVALPITTVLVPVGDADRVAVPKRQKEPNVTITQDSVDAVQELQVAIANVVYLDSGITLQQDANHATVMKILPSELGVTLQQASVLVCLVL